MVWTLHFRGNGEWFGYSATGMPIRPPLKPSRLFVVVEELRRAWLSIGPLVWLVLLIATLVLWWRWRRAARVSADALSLVALTCFLGWLLAPNYTLTLKGMLSNDNLFWGVCMLIASLVIRRMARKRAESVPPGHCPTCGYDLRGNTSGVCPECGAEAQARVSAA